MNERNSQELVELLRELKVELAGVSLVTDDYRKAVDVTRILREKLSVPIIWGGAHANVKPLECLKHADMVCLGEGEEALLELADNISSGETLDTDIKNIWFKSGDDIIKNGLRNLEINLDKYPFADFDTDTQYVMTESGFENLAERHLNGRYSVMSSRGCPYSCRYCYNSYRKKQYDGKGKYLRTRSIANVVEELCRAIKQFKSIKKIDFWDDSFIARRLEEFNEFENLYAERINLPFFCLVEPMAFHFEKIEILKRCGLTGLQVGIQSGSQRVNKEVYNRIISNDKVLKMANFINDHKIDVVYDLIFNNPYETKQDLRETVELLLQFPKPFSLQGFNLIFYPGTDITQSALEDGFIREKDGSDDFSTIEGTKDSPVTTRGKGKVSGRFYEVDYDSEDKRYLNQTISLLAYSHVPRIIVRFFARSETPVKKCLLNLFLMTYPMLGKIRRAIGLAPKV